MNPVIKKPSECSLQELEDFAELVIEGGQVARAGLENRMRRAKLLAFGYEDGKLVGVVAIKKASWFYVRDVFGKANEPDQAVDYRYELGWGFTLPDYRRRGITTELSQMLMDNSRDCNLFGTTGTGNEASKRILEKYGFEMCGSPYPGRTEFKQLYVRKLTTGSDLGTWFLKNADLLLREAEKSNSYRYLLNTFRRTSKTRVTGVH